MMSLTQFFDSAWDRYCSLTPDAPKITGLLKERGENIINDHIAFRTFNLPGIDRLSLGGIFEEWGYQSQETLEFPEKKLLATYYLHSNPDLPKIFISELLLQNCSQPLQRWINSVAGGTPLPKKLTAEVFLKPNWNPVGYEDYIHFYAESEYAAWTAAFGIQVNHFTVFVNSLRSFSSLQVLDDFLIQNGFTLNESGGLIKGTPSEYLEQSSTMARKIPWKFRGGVEKEIMGCYFEFAKRYPIRGGQKLFQGFVPKSADKIFESTFEK